MVGIGSAIGLQVVMVCDPCSKVISDDDWSLIEDEASVNTITAVLELMNDLEPAGSVDVSGYWECALCWDIQIGRGKTFRHQ